MSQINTTSKSCKKQEGNILFSFSQVGTIEHFEGFLENCSTYLWGMKKHMAADEAAWRELAKRITTLQVEKHKLERKGLVKVFVNLGDKKHSFNRSSRGENYLTLLIYIYINQIRIPFHGHQLLSFMQLSKDQRGKADE
uniref:Transposase n=1 Tax=Heterorhabditis bacteriophora TaxID=37862 RepID=A0A1I7WT47_HETBA